MAWQATGRKREQLENRGHLYYLAGAGRSIMLADGMTVADPVAMVAAGVRLVDCYGAPWVALELAP